MKVLICFYEIQDFGGILNNQEGLYKGLLELGHKVKVVALHWKESVKPNTSSKGIEDSAFGGKLDYQMGWTRMERFAYKGAANLKRWKEYASKFDLIIWQIPVPPKGKGNEGNLDWLELYNVPVKQIAYVHDGNMIKSYPHIYCIVKHLTGAAGTHPCSYHSLAHLPVQRALAFTAQVDIEKRIRAADEANKKRSGWFSLQTFKAWKHVDDIIRAVPFMGDYPKILAGGGIEYYYMTSKEKIKPEYDGIWYEAECAGLDYRGWVTNARREKILHKSACLIDPSWSISYAKLGDHMNRVVIDALIAGAAPIARNLGVATNKKGIGELFKPDENYFMIPYNATPKEFAQHVDHYVSPDFRANRAMVVNTGRQLLKYWDYRVVAQTFIDLSRGQRAGYYYNVSVGKHNKVIESSGNYLRDHFFNDKPIKQRKLVGG